MAENKNKGIAGEVAAKTHLPGATAEVRKQMADPGLMKSRGYIPEKNKVNPSAAQGGAIPKGMEKMEGK